MGLQRGANKHGCLYIWLNLTAFPSYNASSSIMYVIYCWDLNYSLTLKKGNCTSLLFTDLIWLKILEVVMGLEQ